MASSESILKIIDELSSLSINQRTQQLFNLKILLESTQLQDIHKCSPNISFPMLFECLNAENRCAYLT